MITLSFFTKKRALYYLAIYIILNGQIIYIKWASNIYYFGERIGSACLFLILLDTFRLYKL